MTLLLGLILLACNITPEGNDIPAELEGKKTMLKELRAEQRQLEKLINQLELSILQQDSSLTEKPRKLVTVQPVELKDFRRFIEIQGTVESDDIVAASSEIGGRLIEMPWQEGESIRKGQLVASLDTESVNKQIAELETSLELAVEVFERQKRLWDQNIGSEIQFLQAKNNKERLEKSLETVRFQLTKAKVYAPISGVVDRVLVQAGEVTAPGGPIVQILNTDKVKVVANVPENYLGVVKPGEMVDIRFPALAEEIRGRVSQIGRVINPANRTFEVEVNLPNSNGLLKPNLLALMLISDYEQKDAVVLPLELVQQEVSGRNYVFIKKDSVDGPVARKVYVETGESYQNEIVITSGLTGEELLIVDGARGLVNNELIKV